MLLIVYPVVVVWLCEGARWLLFEPRRGAVAVGVALLLTHGGAALASRLQVPADPRYFVEYGLEPTESRSALADNLARRTAIRPWPDVTALTRHGPLWRPLARQDLQQRPQPPPVWGWPQPPPMGPPVTLMLDLSQAPWDDHPLLAVTDGAPDLDLTLNTGRWLVPKVPVAWEPAPVSVTAIAGSHAHVLEVTFREPEAAPCLKGERRCSFYAMFDPGISHRAALPARVVHAPGPKLRLRLPAGPLTLLLTVNRQANVVRVQRYLVEPQAVALLEALEFWHN